MYALQSPLTAASDAAPVREPAAGRTYFFLTAQAECGLMLRVLQSFARLGVTPYRVHVSTEHGSGEEMSMELRIKGADRALAERLAALSRCVIGVHSVLTAVED
jgi:hypothetical protein